MSPVLSTRVERDLITFFNVLAALGFFSIVAVLVPALLSPRVKRSRAWFGVLMSWLLYSISYLLLIGRQTGPNPPLGLCMFQATLIYVTSPLCAVATTCFAFDFYLKLSRASSKGNLTGRNTARTLIFFPWALALMIAGEAILSVNDVSKLQRNTSHSYCHITNPVPSLVNIIIVFLCVVTITPLEIYTGILLHRNWTLFKRLSKSRARIALSTLVRLALFSFIITLSLVLTITGSISNPAFEAAWRMVLISLPTFSALCFGTQRDILGAWVFWKRESITAHPSDTEERGVGNDSRVKLDV